MFLLLLLLLLLHHFQAARNYRKGAGWNMYRPPICMQPLERRLLLSQYALDTEPGSFFRATTVIDFGAIGFQPTLVQQLDGERVLFVAMMDFDSPTPDRRLVMVQFDRTGETVQSWGSGGKVTGIELDMIWDEDAQRDGSVLILGEENRTFFAARYAVDGALDTGFSGDGIFELPIQGLLGTDEFFTPGGIVRAPDGKIVVLGSISSTHASAPLLMRLTSAGTLDPTFDGDGIAMPTAPAGFQPNVNVQTDGKIVVTGRDDSGSFVHRYNADGALDTTFGNGGVALFPDFNIVSSHVLPDGRILITTGVETIARLTSAGALDTTFGDNGIATMLPDVHVDDGAQFYTGDGGTITVVSIRGTTRFTSNGQLDPTYGIARQVPDSLLNELGGPYISSLSVAALADDGDLLLSGPPPGGGEVAVVRLAYHEEVHLNVFEGRLSIEGTNEPDTIVVEAVGSDVVVTRNGEISSFALADVQRVELTAGAGDDSITVSLAVPTLILGGEGDDTIVAGDGANTIRAGNGNDSITTGAGDDSIDAGDGSDFIDSGGGSDQITAGIGSDTIFAGDGNDTVGTSGADSTVDAGAGNDRVQVSGSNSSAEGGDGDDYLVGGLSSVTLIGSAGNDTLRPGDGDNLVEGNDGDDFIKAGSGNDTIHGGAGNDSIYAGDGDNLVFTGDGDDYVQSGTGADTLWGEIGYDSIKAGGGDDVVNGGAGKDRIWGQDGNDRLYGRRGNDAIDGGPGDDRLTGEEGFDKLFGGSGNDRIFAQAGDADFVDGGDGDDHARVDELLDLVMGVETL